LLLEFILIGAHHHLASPPAIVMDASTSRKRSNLVFEHRLTSSDFINTEVCRIKEETLVILEVLQ
jgi:hypothetical protein